MYVCFVVDPWLPGNGWSPLCNLWQFIDRVHIRNHKRDLIMSDDPIDVLHQKINSAKTEKLKSDIHASSNTTHQNEKNISSGLRAGTELIGGIVGGILFGVCADWMFSLSPVGLIVGAILGVTSGFYGVYRSTF